MNGPTQIGSYRIERLLGTGSFATVWLGYDASLDARVAIKVLAENWSHDLRVRERFLDEARMLWRLDHERIIRVYSLGELPDGRPYLVMAWADRGSLRDRLNGGPLPATAGLHLLREISAGVAVLHDSGIVHRDLTPGNVLFQFRSGTEQVVIADLGLAKALAAASGLTARAGTPGYMAPEQDDPLAVVDVRTDVYGLGRLGLRLLAADGAGRQGAGRQDPEIRQGAGRQDPEIRLRDGVPLKVGDVLRTATAHRPADRYPDAAAFTAALDRATDGQPVARGPGSRGRRTLAGLLVLAVLGATLVADSVQGRAPVPDAATDSTGQITVTLPFGWRAKGGGWEGQPESDGQRAAGLRVSTDPDRWVKDSAVAGAFIGLSRAIAARTTPREYVTVERRPADCAAAPVRTSRLGDIEWVVAWYTCPAGRPVIVETAGVGPGGTGLAYVQITPPAGSGPEFVDMLLAGIRIGPTE